MICILWLCPQQGESQAAARRGEDTDGEAVQWNEGKEEEANKCVGVYWAASEIP